MVARMILAIALSFAAAMAVTMPALAQTDEDAVVPAPDDPAPAEGPACGTDGADQLLEQYGIS